ncbi:MAG: hypothetical protein M3R25_14450, partial [Bacteroidota bacterium]|nr:hypothetical protein [Bacteroidota bacterium]
VGTIGINVPGADIYNWQGIPGPDSSNAFINVTVAGTYFVNALDVDTGCEITGAAQLFADLAPPVFTSSTDTVSCLEPFGEIFFYPSPGVQYADVRWQLPDMTTSSGTSLVVSEPGQYLLSVTGLNGCVGTNLLEVFADTVLPIFFLESDTIGCDQLGFANTIAIDSLVSISWTGPGGFSSTDFNPMIADTGSYTVTGFGINGCSATRILKVRGNINAPRIFLSVDTLGCITDSAKFEITSPDSIVNYAWTDNNGILLDTDAILVVTLPGTYFVSVEGNNHCISTDTIELPSAVFPVITLVADTLTCRDTLVPIIATANIPSPLFVWSDLNGNILSQVDLLEVNTTGPFIISVIGDNGCE